MNIEKVGAFSAVGQQKIGIVIYFFYFLLKIVATVLLAPFFFSPCDVVVNLTKQKKHLR